MNPFFFHDYLAKHTDTNRPLSGLFYNDLLIKSTDHVIILGDNPNNNELQFGHGYSFTNTSNMLLDLLLTKFKFLEQPIIIVEDSLCRINDPKLESEEFKPFFFKNSNFVYWLKTIDSQFSINSIFKHANGLPYFAFLFDSTYEKITTSFTTDSKQYFSDKLIATLIGINDDERLLCIVQ
jgi:hypothetical protein